MYIRPKNKIRKVAVLLLLFAVVSLTCTNSVSARVIKINTKISRVKMKGSKKTIKCKIMNTSSANMQSRLEIMVPKKGNYSIKIVKCKPGMDILTTYWSFPVEIRGEQIGAVSDMVFSKGIQKFLKKHKYQKSSYSSRTFVVPNVSKKITIRMTEAKCYTELRKKTNKRLNVVPFRGGYFYTKGQEVIPMNLILVVSKVN